MIGVSRGLCPIVRSDAPEVPMADPVRIRGGLRRVETDPIHKRRLD